MKNLKGLRVEKKITQKEAAKRLGVSLRSYISYENDKSKIGTSKYKYMISEMENINRIDEEHGILSQSEIVRICGDILKEYDIRYCYLFGSYARGMASETSDIDLLVSSNLTGLRFYELVEKLREALCKKVDVLDFKQLMMNAALTDEILKDGIRIYG